jgi:hypothetical protein
LESTDCKGRVAWSNPAVSCEFASAVKRRKRRK